MADEETNVEETSTEEDIDAAVKEATAEVDPPKEEEASTEEEAPAEEEAPKEEPKEEPEDHDLNLTAEQLNKLQETEEGRALYKSVQRGLTQKAQAIADERKANEEALATAKFIQENPDKALEILAEKRGRRIAPREEEAKKEEAVDEIFDKWKGALGGEEQAKQFYPLLKESFESFFQSQIVPLQKQQEEITRNAQAAEYQAGVAKFGASVVEKGGEWNNEVQDKMTEKMNYIAPADKATLDQYLKVLHDSVLQDELEATTKQKAVTRLRNAEKKDEPTKASRTAKADARQVTVEMDLDEALDLAVKQAQAEAE